jgi:AraC-like DNA-binding protein
MADSDRPNLGLHVYGEIETKQIAVDASHWEQLRELQVFLYFETLSLGSPTPTLPPAKRPIRLRAVLASYASALFVLEASEYPRNPRLKHWLEKLADRTRVRVMDAVARLESGSGINHFSSLSYHDVKVTEMSATIDQTLRPLIEEHLRKQAIPGVPSPPETTAGQLQKLRDECRWTIEDLAGATNLSPRQIARHLSGKFQPLPRNISAYERAFSKMLKRQIVIVKMS